MPARSFLQFLLLIALVLAPICGMGSAAMAMPTGAPTAEHHAAPADQGHCADMGGQQDDGSQGGSGFDCRMACAGVLALTVSIGETQFIANVPRSILIAVPAPGLNPAAEPPPPRFS